MKNELFDPHKSSIGELDANLVALLAYLVATVVGWIPIIRYVAWLAPLILFYMEKQSGLVKFHAMQAFVLNVLYAVLAFVVSVVIAGILGVGSISAPTAIAAVGVAGILGLISLVISIALLIITIIAMMGAYNYKETHIPIIGEIAEKLTHSLGK